MYAVHDYDSYSYGENGKITELHKDFKLDTLTGLLTAAAWKTQENVAELEVVK